MEVNYRRKYLTADQQIKLVTDYNSGYTELELINKYKCSRSTIYRILRKQAN